MLDDQDKMTQERIAQLIMRHSKRLYMIMGSTTKAHNYEKQMLISDLKNLTEMLKFTGEVE